MDDIMTNNNCGEDDHRLWGAIGQDCPCFTGGLTFMELQVRYRKRKERKNTK